MWVSFFKFKFSKFGDLGVEIVKTLILVISHSEDTAQYFGYVYNKIKNKNIEN